MSQTLTEPIEERMGLGGRGGGGGREEETSNKIEMEVIFNQHSDNTKNLLVDDEMRCDDSSSRFNKPADIGGGDLVIRYDRRCGGGGAVREAGNHGR